MFSFCLRRLILLCATIVVMTGCISSTPEPISTPMPVPTSTPEDTRSLTATGESLQTEEPSETVDLEESATGTEYKTVGDSYENSDLAIKMMDFNIKDKGVIWLKFSITNKKNNNILVRFQNNYFSVKDDTGKIYQQDEDALIEPKQVELSAGESFDIKSDGYPDNYTEIGYFYGMTLENANELIVNISQFSTLKNLEWRIPLNPHVTIRQSPDPGTQQSLVEGFSADGISIHLTDYEIKYDGRIWLEFLIRNDGNNPVLLRYKNKYYKVFDDLGNEYPQDEDAIIEPKQKLLLPGESYEIRGDGYPDYYAEVGYFYGLIPENANDIIVKISNFSSLSDLQWLIPLNAQVSSPQSPPPGTQQPLVEGFSANGISVNLMDYDIKSDGRIWLKILVRNEGNNAVLLRYVNQYFEVFDNLGNQYPQDEDAILEPKQFLLLPDKSYEIKGDGYPDNYSEIGYFYGMVAQQVEYLIVRISQFADMTDMQWSIPLN